MTDTVYVWVHRTLDDMGAAVFDIRELDVNEDEFNDLKSASPTLALRKMSAAEFQDYEAHMMARKTWDARVASLFGRPS